VVRIALKECSWERWGETLVVVCDPSKQIELEDPEGHAEVLLTALASGPQSLPELRPRLAESGLEVDIAELRAAVAALDSTRLLEAADDDATPASPALDGRYLSNLAFFALFATLDAARAELQRRLSRSHVLQLGTGGLGSNVLQSLAGLGVGRLTLLDHDLVEPRNFARQFLYRESDIGHSKVRRAADWVREFDSRIEVATVQRRVGGPGDVADLLDGVDLVVSGIDQPGTVDQSVDQWVNEACVGAGVPWVRGGMLGTELSYFSVDPGRSPCLACWKRKRYDVEASAATVEAVGIRVSAGLPRVNPGIGPAAALIGSLVAFEALRYLTGYEPPYAAGAHVYLEIAGGCQQRREPWPGDPDCALCRRARERLPEAMEGMKGMEGMVLR
jgi:molybdopterin/thiamine biosynthesis adenylyltransferase